MVAETLELYRDLMDAPGTASYQDFDNGMSFGIFAEEDLNLLREVLSLVPGAVPVVA